MRLTIVIPTYNERDNLAPLVSMVEAAVGAKTDEYELLFVDDSTDETPALLARMAAANPHVRFLHREEKSGLASAVVLGFENARGEVIAVMDADLQHPPALLADMLAVIDEGADIVLPSRYIGGGESEGLSPIRTLASKSAKYAARLFLPSMKNVSDPMSGFFMFRREVIDGVALNPIGWKILMEVLAMGHYKRVVEIPYAFEKRKAGESKLSFKVTVEYFLHILSLAGRGIRERARYDQLLSCVLGILGDVAAFGFARRSLPLFGAVCVGVLAACLAHHLCYYELRGKKEARFQRMLPFLGMIAILLALKVGASYLLWLAGLQPVFMNLWAAVLAMLVYGLFLHRLLYGRPDGQAITTYEVRVGRK